MSRAERTAENRAAILDAARTVFLRSGYHATTVEAISREAGLTIGALYSRFDSKADLFLALAEERVSERAEHFAGAAAEIGPGAAARELAQRWSALMRSDLDWTLLLTEFRVHAARDPLLSKRYSELHDRAIEGLAGNIAACLPAGTDPERVELLARAALATSFGAALARAAEGDAFPDELWEEISLAIGTHLLGMELR